MAVERGGRVVAAAPGAPRRDEGRCGARDYGCVSQPGQVHVIDTAPSLLTSTRSESPSIESP